MGAKKFNIKALKEAGKEAHMQPKVAISEDLVEQVGGEVLRAIPVDAIENNPMQPRISVDDDRLQELATSIEKDSLITPISVFKVDDGRYILKAGQRRWLAHKILGLKTIKAVVSSKTYDDKEELGRVLFEIAMSENIHRDDLDPLEVAIAIKDAMTKGYYRTIEEASKGIKKSASYLTKLMKVLNLDNEILDDLKRNKTTTDVEALYYLQKVAERDRQVDLYYQFVQSKIDRAGLKDLIIKKTSHAKKEFVIKKTNSTITLRADVKKIDKKRQEEFSVELEELVKKYYNT